MPDLTPEEIAAAEVEAAEAKVQADAEAAALVEVEAEEAAIVEAEVLAEAEATAAAEAVKPKQSFQDRINELTYKYRESERQAKHWQDIAENKTAKPAVAPSDASSSIAGQRPIATGYDTVEAYEDALFGWYEGKQSAKAATETKKTAVKAALGTFNKNAASMRIEHEDFDKVIEAPVFTDPMRDVIFTIEGGPMVAYYLGKNPDEANRIKDLSPEKQMYEVSKLETKLLLVQKAKTKTGASAIIKPVGSTAVSTKNPDDMEIGEWMEWNKQQEIAKLKKKMGE